MILQEQNRIPHKDYHPPCAARGKNTSPAFGNGAFVALEQSEMLGPILVDAIGMIAPRTAIDSTRGHEAGIETARREIISGVMSFYLPGAAAIGAGALLAGFKKGTNLFIAGDMVDELKDSWKKGGDIKGYFEHTLGRAEGLVGNKQVGFKEKESKAVNKLIDDLVNLVDNSDKKAAKDLEKRAVELLGAEKNITLGKAGTSMKYLLRNAVEMGRVFSKDPSNVDNIAKNFKRNGLIKSGLGVGLGVVGGFALQAVNRYLTSKKTGSTAFVGLPDYEQQTHKMKQAEIDKETADKKKGLLPWKLVAAGTMLYTATASIVNQWNPIKMPKALFNRDALRKMVEMKSNTPSLNNLKLMIGFIMAGRMLAADDKHELRETAFRDILFSFPFMLIVSDLINNAAAWKLSKKNGMREKVFNGNVDAVKDAGSIFKKTGAVLGLKMKTYAEMGVDEAAKSIKRKSVVIGYAISTAVLGVSVPIFNKWMTNSTYKKEHKGQTGLDNFRKTVPVAQGFGIS